MRNPNIGPEQPPAGLKPSTRMTGGWIGKKRIKRRGIDRVYIAHHVGKLRTLQGSRAGYIVAPNGAWRAVR